MQISHADMCHFVGVMAMLISWPVVVMKAWEFLETVEGVLVEGAQSLDGVGWVAGGQILALRRRLICHCRLLFW